MLDKQLQRTVRQFEQVEGVVENIDKTSKQLRQALEEGKTIIVTTLQKFPVIAEQIGALAGQRFAVITDEAHSSQGGLRPTTVTNVAGELPECRRLPPALRRNQRRGKGGVGGRQGGVIGVSATTSGVMERVVYA